MSEPIKLINSFTWFRGQAHQEAAIQWLDQNLPDELREEFGRKFRQKPVEMKLTQPSIVQLEMSWTGKTDPRGFRIFRLTLTNNGRAVDAIDVLSGNSLTQTENFIRPEQDYSGSGRCLPEGVYSVGHVEDSQLLPAAPSWGEGIGRYWMSLEVLPRYASNNRSAFGIHADDNASYSPGSSGCVCPLDTKDLKTILKWMSAKARPVQLVCDLKTGFLEECGYQPPSAIVQKIAAQTKVENKPKNEIQTNRQEEAVTDLEHQLAQRFGVDVSTIEMLLEALSQRLHFTPSSSEGRRQAVEPSENGTAANPIFSDAEQGVS